MYIYIFLLRMTDTVTSQNVDLSSWDTLYSVVNGYVIITTLTHSMTYVERCFRQTIFSFSSGALSLGVKRPRRVADHSPPGSAEVKKMLLYISTPRYAFMA
jgi:hypothetical protein